MARVAIDARVVTSEPDGVGRYARELVPALAGAAPHDEFLVLRHPSRRDPIAGGCPNVREVWLDGTVGHLLDHFLADGRRLQALFDQDGWPDLYHSLFHLYARRFPDASRRPRPAVVVTLHDLIWLDHPFAHGPVWAGVGTWVTARVAVVASLKRADAVIAVSHATCERAGHWLSHDRRFVVHHGVNARLFAPPPGLPDALAFLEADRRPWIVAVGNDKKYKNLSRLVDAFALAVRRGLDARLVLLGPCSALRPMADRLDVGDRVVFAGPVNDEALVPTVGRAAMFVHPALVEGFGMPVLEAMALGTPTAIADVPVLREVAGDAALRFDPADSGELARLIEEVVGSQALRDDLRARGRERAAAFTWERAARETLDVYRHAMARGDGDADLR